MKRWSLIIEVLEDLHIGAGIGRGDIDAVQVRDRRGWPVLPASHIKGVLRETARQWQRCDAAALAQEDIDCLFGRQGSGQGCLQLTSAYLRQSLNSLIWGSTRIDATTGSAQEDTLRFVEYIPAGASFEMELALAPDSDEQTEARLWSIIGRCGYLGGGRHRGHGRVRWKRVDSPSATPPALKPPAGYPARLRLLLRNLDPLCLAQTGHPGNIIATEPFIRGRALRGAFAASCLALNRSDWAQALLSPNLAWSDALPLPQQEAPICADTAKTLEVLPIPLSVGTPKRKAVAGPIPWWAGAGGRDNGFGARGEIDQIAIDDSQRPTEKLKRPSEGEFLFRASPDHRWQRYQPQLIERLHTRVPCEDNHFEQALFLTEEIAERTVFVSDLIVTEAGHAQILCQMLDALAGQWLRVGRGGRPVIIEQAAWLPMPARTATSGPGGEFTLLLESDLIVRDGRGNFLDRLDADTVAALANIDGAKLTEKQNFSEGVTIFGFNAATGLPRLAQRAVKAGSVIRLSGPDAGKVRDALAARLALGECPDEGFGRFRLDDLPKPEKPDPLPQTAKAAVNPEEALCAEAREWAQKLAKAASAPSASQWGDFRSRVLAARDATELDAVFSLLEEAAGKHGGKAWKGFIENSAELRQALRRDFADAQRLLDYFARWVRAEVISNVHREVNR
ncbi:MAG: RAMP superfamily CRISPR-associated protein [Halothiobacillaceae bacterium]